MAEKIIKYNAPSLSEGLFLSKGTSVSYLQLMQEIRSAIDGVNNELKKSLLSNKVKIINSSNAYPLFYKINKKDDRLSWSLRISEPFSIAQITRDTGLSDHIVEQQLTEISNNMTGQYIHLEGGIYYTDNFRKEMALYLFMDASRFCLDDIIVRSKDSKIQMTTSEYNSLIDRYKKDVINLIRKHPLGEMMFVNEKSLKGKTFTYDSLHGKGYIDELSTAPFVNNDFSNFNLDTFQAYVNLNYYINEKLLNTTLIGLSLFSTKDGGSKLYLGSNNNVNVV